MPKYSFIWKVGGGSRSLHNIEGNHGLLVNTGKLVTESRNDGPEPLVFLFGCANETRVVVEGVETTAWWILVLKSLPSLRDSVMKGG